MVRTIISYDFSSKEIRILEDCTLQQLVNIVKEHESDLTKIKVKAQQFYEPEYTTTVYTPETNVILGVF